MDYLSQGLTQALALLLHMDAATLSAITATLVSTAYAMTAAMLLGLPCGFALGYYDFPGKRCLRLISDTLLAFPTVLIGLLVYAFITYRGPLGEYGLLFTLPGMAVGQAVLALPKPYRTAIHLHCVEGYSVAEVGELLGLKVSTVQTRLARGREKLKRALEEA